MKWDAHRRHLDLGVQVSDCDRRTELFAASLEAIGNSWLPARSRDWLAQVSVQQFWSANLGSLAEEEAQAIDPMDEGLERVLHLMSDVVGVQGRCRVPKALALLRQRGGKHVASRVARFPMQECQKPPRHSLGIGLAQVHHE